MTPGYELRSLEQRHGWNAWQAFPEPQGLAGPKFGSVLHALLNTEPEMQHWPSGNDIVSARALARFLKFRVTWFISFVAFTPPLTRRMGACGLL